MRSADPLRTDEPRNGAVQDEALGRLNAAAALIRAGRRKEVEKPEDSGPILSGPQRWELVVSHAAREASSVNAKLADVGLDIGSIALVRRKDDRNRHLDVCFHDGGAVRMPVLSLACLKDGEVGFEWHGREPEPGLIDFTEELGPQIRRLIVCLCERVAGGYDEDA